VSRSPSDFAASGGRADTNSKRTGVEPIFDWLRNHATEGWPAKLVELAEGLRVRIETGALQDVHFEQELRVPIMRLTGRRNA
jgi:hypothetical protein